LSRTDDAIGSGFASFADNIMKHMQLGANGENWREIPGVDSTLPAVQRESAIFNYTDIATLTREYVADARLEASLIACIDAAKADPLVKAEAMARYAKLIEGARMVSLPAVQADTLLQIARMM
jgi:hypothetical protein